MKFIPINHNGQRIGSLMLLRYDQYGNILYRSSFNYQRLQSDRPEIHDGICYLGLYSFDEKYLDGLEQAENQVK